jgi:hypothetical protein
MQFDPAIHTKDFLLSNPDVAFELAEKSSEFAKSDLACDMSILSLRESDVGHVVPLGVPLAHYLAQYQSDWIKSAAAADYGVLLLRNNFGVSVAHKLANYQEEWVKSDAAKNRINLQISDHDGNSVAHVFMRKGLSMVHVPMFAKEILTITCDNELLAENIVEKHAKSHGITKDFMIMKLIGQGAAYKHSKPLAIAIGNSVLKQTKQLIEDCFEPAVAFKQSMALYSTFHHNIVKIRSSSDQKPLEKWRVVLQSAEDLLKNVLQSHPNLFDADIVPDIFCEPGVDAFNRLKSQRILGSINEHGSSNENQVELTSKIGLY